MRKTFLSLFFCMMVSATMIWAQESENLEDILENFQDADIGQTDFLEMLKDLQDHPININRATLRELLRIPFLNQQTAGSIIRHRREIGQYSGKTDLLEAAALSEELVDAILPYIEFQSRRRLAVFDYRFRIAGALHKTRAFVEKRYGNPLYVYQRIRWRPNPDVQVGLIWEKDIGENNILDFGSFHFKYHWRKAKSHIQIGDYNIEAGQRLVFSSTYGSPLVIANAQPFTATPFRWRSKSAVDENAFLRGILWDYSPGAATKITMAYSRHSLDATLSPDSQMVASMYTAGYHRSESEEKKRDLVDERIIAAMLNRSFAKGHAGLLAANVHYSLPIEQNEAQPRDQFNYISAYYSMQKRLLHLQGEAAFLEGKYPAIQQTLFLRSRDIPIAFGTLIYYYHPAYWAFHGRGFGKTGAPPMNEYGYFQSITARMLPKTKLAAYFHHARPVSASGAFPFVRSTYQIQLGQSLRKIDMLFRFTNRLRRGPIVDPNRNFAITGLKTSILRLHLTAAVSRSCQLSTRFEMSWAKAEGQAQSGNGFNFYWDVRLRPHKNLKLQLRWTQFDVPGFDFRLYEFENDLPGSFRNILLTGRGYKWFFLMSLRLLENWRLAVKYRHMVYPDTPTIGSGLNTILGNRRQELRFQIQAVY